MREPTLLILTALAAEPLHGYAITQRVETLSEGRVRLRAGTLYAALDRLSEEGALKVATEEVVEGRLRRTYRITAKGLDLLRADVAVMERNVKVAQRELARRAKARPA